mgnify:FL=1
MTVNKILEEIENLLVNAGRVPFTNKCIIEEDDLAQLLDELRDALPQEIMEAKRIINERQRILEEAQQEARKIVEQAQTYISRLTDENVINKQAQEQAAEIVARAAREARELEYSANKYADDVFKYLEENLEKVLSVIRESHKSIQQAAADKEACPQKEKR